MNGIIIGITFIVATVIICYTIYKIKSNKIIAKIIKDDINYILDRYDRYQKMTKDKDADAWKYSVNETDFIKILNTIKRYYKH